MKIMVSACLLGVCCKYDGGSNRNDELIRRLENHTVVPVCPETEGGLPVPRVPAEITGGAVVNREGRNVTAEFVLGTEKALQTALLEKPDLIILQSRSPSCGVNEIYDGTFSGKLVPGKGLFAKKACEHGFCVTDVKDYLGSCDTMEKILITAFEPFGGNKRNASLEVLKRLPDAFHGIPAEKLTLPVCFREAADQVLKHPAGCVFLLGEAGGRQDVTPELRAVNLRNARIPDNAGFQPENEKILASGPDEYRTRIPAETIVGGMRSEGWPVALSEDAGTYVCNDTFYLVGTGSDVPVEFIHVPAVPDEAEGFAKTVAAYIRRAVESLLQPAATAKGRRETALTIPDDGILLSAVLEKPEKEGEVPLCVFLHGFGSDKNSPHQVAAAAAMRECGFATLRFDLYGHGASGGTFRDHTLFKWITNTLTVIDFARKELGFRDIWLSGHSQGGLVAAVAAGMEADRIRGLILRAPAFMLPDWARLGNKIGLPFDPDRIPDSVKIFDDCELGGNYMRVAQVLYPVETMKRFRSPVLIVQGEDDDVVRADVPRKAAEAYADCEFVLIRGEGHHFDHHLDEMLSAIRDWTARKAGFRS